MKRLSPYIKRDAKLVDAVMEEMRRQIDIGDWTVIDELLYFVPRKNLIGFLPEEKWEEHEKKSKKKA